MKKLILLLSLCLLFTGGCSSSGEELIIEGGDYSPSETETALSENDADYAALEEPGRIFVYICGEIERPGVYELLEGSRLYELINKAGGLSERASGTFLNQAEVLSDGQKIYVPSYEEALKGAVAPDDSLTADVKALDKGSSQVNINTADVAALCSISGIGESRARDIVAYRETNGYFTSIEDIMKVSGIKNGLFEKIKTQITVK